MSIKSFDPFTDQEPFPVEVVSIIGQHDTSGSYALDAGAIFRTADGRFLGVVVSGCS
jgi:hypothetical protein